MNKSKEKQVMRFLAMALIMIIAMPIAAQDIDFPLSLKEVRKFSSRVTLTRLPDVEITHPAAYKIETERDLYTTGTKKIRFNVINMSGPTAEPENYSMNYWKNGRWQKFPFRDFIGFAGVGCDLAQGDTVAKAMPLSVYKYPLRPNRYQVNFCVFTNIYTHCDLTDSTVTATSGTEVDGAFEFCVLSCTSDSLRIMFANHTNLEVQPLFFPSVDTDSTYEAHPLARSGSSDEAQYMRKQARLKGGQAILFTIPTTWNVNRINKFDRERYKSGRLANGRYKIGLQIEAYMNKEIRVKKAK